MLENNISAESISINQVMLNAFKGVRQKYEIYLKEKKEKNLIT